MKRLALLITVLLLSFYTANSQGYAGVGAALYGRDVFQSTYGVDYGNKVGIDLSVLLGKILINVSTNFADGRGEEINPPPDFYNYHKRVSCTSMSLGYKFEHERLSIIPYVGGASTAQIFQDEFSILNTRTYYVGKYKNHFNFGAILSYAVSKKGTLLYIGGGYLERFKAGLMFKFYEKGQAVLKS